MNHIMQKMITIIFCLILFVTFLVVIFSIVSGNERFLNNFVLTSFTRLSHEPAKVKKSVSKVPLSKSMIFGHFYDHLSLPYFLPLTIHTAANFLEMSQNYNVNYL